MRKTTLSRKILLRSVMLLVAMFLLGLASLWAISILQTQVQTATKEYAELRQIDSISVHIANAAGLLYTPRIAPQSPRTAPLLKSL